MKNRIALIIFTAALTLFPAGLSFAAEVCEYEDSKSLNLGALMRGYYFYDRRLLNGLESTFAAEGVIGFDVDQKCRWGDLVSASGEFYINQPFGKNISKNQTRSVFTTVYDADPFEVSELYLQVRRSAVDLKLGKAGTPFGRYYFPIYSNARFDAPFIRTEAVIWKETGLMLRYTPGVFSLDLAVTNGEREKDTNSSKAAIARVGAGGQNWAFGISGKKQDGQGSEYLKVYNNHVGVDLMFRSSRLTFSSEAIYDEYGCTREGCESYEPERRSLYHRDIYFKNGVPITGWGGYIDILYEGSYWTVDLNYGEFYPREIGNPFHDDTIKRGILKTAYGISSCMKAFFVGLVENERVPDPARGDKDAHQNFAVMGGLQYVIAK